jgi:2'-5' RNA ligase
LGQDDAQAVGVSLWLSPGGEEAAAMATLIGEMSGRFGTPRFEPHLTLLGGLGTPEDEAGEKALRLAGRLRPVPMPLREVTGEPAFFRCLYAAVEAGPELESARAEALALFAPEPERAFRPHLSLVYGRLAPEAKAELARALRPRLPGAILARHLDLVRTQGPPEHWWLLRRFDLGAGAGIISG